MSDSELHNRLTALILWFKGMGVRPVQKDDSVAPKNPKPCNESLAHIYWLVTQALIALLSSRRLDAERYYGFVSGVLWWCGMGPDQDGVFVYGHQRSAGFDGAAKNQTTQRADVVAATEVSGVSQ